MTLAAPVQEATGEKRYFMAVGFGALAAACYAAQHPLSKPIADDARRGSLEFLWLVIASEILFAGLALTMLFCSPAIRRGVKGIFRTEGARWKLTLHCAMGGLTLCLYLYGLSFLDQVFLAAILNVYPFWSVVVGYLLFPQKLSRHSIKSLELSLLGVCLATLIVFGNSEFQRDSLWNIALFSLVPIGYAIAFFMRHQFFDKRADNGHDGTGNDNVMAFIVATSLFNAPVIMTVALGVVVSAEGLRSVQVLWSPNLLPFLLGGLSGYAGGYLLHKGTAQSGATAWVVSMMLFLTPSFTFGATYILVHGFGFAIPVRDRYAYLVLLISLYMLIYEIARRFRSARTAPT